MHKELNHPAPPLLFSPSTQIILPLQLGFLASLLAILPPVSTTLVKLVAKFAAGVVVTGVVVTGGAP